MLFLLIAACECAFKLVSTLHSAYQDKPFVMYKPIESMESFELNSLKKRKHIVPDHTDPETVLTLAKMTLDSYYEPGQSGWLPIPGYNVTAKFGWEQTGIRGYLFQDTDQDVLVIVIKGTSLATPIGSGPTAKLDKLNDNMMFSCCCAKAGWEWTPICNCPTDSNHCSKSCLLRESNFDGSYYNLAQTIYLAVQEWFPKRTAIWMAGHSLGGALATLVALTNNVPAFAFQAPGDMLYASRLGLLPDVPDLDAYLDDLSIYHFGNDKDPIYMGQCRGVTSSCYWFDYALESKCHVGKECIYRLDQPSLQKQDLGDNVDIFTAIQYHSIEYVINNILDKRDPVPKCELKRNCLATECTQWEFTD